MIENQATFSLKEYTTKNYCRWQFIEPADNRVNAAERPIQTFKNYFISGLCTTDSEWPVQLWDHLAEQAVITTNLLRSSQINAAKLAYHQFHGRKYDWNAHPMAPPGSRGVIYEEPESRAVLGTR